MTICRAAGCRTYACYSIPGSTPQFCRAHKSPGMINVKQCCKHPGCRKTASFADPGTGARRFCATHKRDDMVNVTARGCKFKGCKHQPTFGMPGTRKPLFCSDHCEIGMVNVVSRKCASPGCQRFPVFNHVGETRGVFCTKHKQDGMVDVVNRLCIMLGCKRHPSYNIPGERRAILCEEHKREGMINVNCRRCTATGCMRQPSFNFAGESQGIRCARHKLEGMVDVENRMCEAHGCNSAAHFNAASEHHGRFCAKHKQDGMINILDRYTSRCQHPECNAQALWGILGKKPQFCIAHRRRGDIHGPRKRCDRCDDFATHGLAGTTTRDHCRKHAFKGEVMLALQPCAECGHDRELDAHERCADCNEKAARRANEMASLRKHMREMLNAVSKYFAKTIREDADEDPATFCLESATNAIFVGIDIDQRCNTVRERARMADLARVAGGGNIFVRFNTSPFLTADDEPALDARIAALARQIDKLVEMPEMSSPICVYMFYDELGVGNTDEHTFICTL